MNLKTVFLTGVSILALDVMAMPAHADNISLNQWYTGAFGPTGSTPMFSPGFGASTGSNGPVLPSGNAAAVQGPGTSGSHVTSWQITVGASGGYLVATDQEESGDHFQFLEGGSGLAPTATQPLGGQPGLANGFTSVPVLWTTNGDSTLTGSNACGEDIGCALGNPDYSSGTFALPAGTNTITATFVGGIGDGDFNFIVESNPVVNPTPEPATMAVLGMGIAGLAAVRRRKR